MRALLVVTALLAATNDCHGQGWRRGWFAPNAGRQHQRNNHRYNDRVPVQAVAPRRGRGRQECTTLDGLDGMCRRAGRCPPERRQLTTEVTVCPSRGRQRKTCCPFPIRHQNNDRHLPDPSSAAVDAHPVDGGGGSWGEGWQGDREDQLWQRFSDALDSELGSSDSTSFYDFDRTETDNFFGPPSSVDDVDVDDPSNHYIDDFGIDGAPPDVSDSLTDRFSVADPLHDDFPGTGSFDYGLTTSRPPNDGFFEPGPTDGGFPTSRPTNDGFFGPGPTDGGFATGRPTNDGFFEPGPTDGGFPTSRPPNDGFFEPGPTDGGFPTSRPTNDGFFGPGPADAGFPTSRPTNDGFFGPGPTDGGFPTTRPTNDGFFEPGPTDGGFATTRPTNDDFFGPGPTDGGFATSHPTNDGFFGPRPTDGGFATTRPTNDGFFEPGPTGDGFTVSGSTGDGEDFDSGTATKGSNDTYTSRGAFRTNLGVVRSTVAPPVETSSVSPPPAECGQPTPKSVWIEAGKVRTVPTLLFDIRVVGGKNAKIGKWPWIALIGNKLDGKPPSFFCGGTLIDDRNVLTAAHCLKRRAVNVKSLVVRLGEYDTSSKEDGANPKDYRVASFSNHRNFRFPVLHDDISVVHLDGTVEFTGAIKPICLPSGPSGDHAGTGGDVAGWGHTEFDGEASNILQEITLPLKAIPDCQAIYENQRAFRIQFPSGFGDTKLCAGGEAQGGRDACQGDSGGPMMRQLKDGRYELIGVVSAGAGCGRPEYPGIYTRVSAYLDWIQQHKK